MAGPESEGGVPPALHRGRPKRGEDKVAISHLSETSSSSSAARIVARLKRDRPDIAERLAAGEFRLSRSVRDCERDTR
jgi:hypothetical protein